MRRRLGPILVGCMAALAIAAVAPAAASASVTLLAALEGTHGYEVTLESVGHKQVKLTVERGEASTSYTARARVTRNGIKANLGRFGEISTRFVSQKRPHRRGSARKCALPTVRLEFGRLLGTIRFNGEDGYTTVALHRTPAARLFLGDRTCKGRPAHHRPKEDRPDVALTLLGVVERSSGRELSFAALGLEEVGRRHGEPVSIPGLFVLAALKERIGRIAIDRSVFLLFEEGILLSEAGIDPVRVTVGLPPPFSGTADFTQAHGSAPTWVGDLAVSFPGAPQVPLTGPGFQAGFCRAASERAFERCAKPFGEGRPQVSGSQSQAFWDVSASWLR